MDYLEITVTPYLCSFARTSFLLHSPCFKILLILQIQLQFPHEFFPDSPNSELIKVIPMPYTAFSLRHSTSNCCEIAVLYLVYYNNLLLTYAGKIVITNMHIYVRSGIAVSHTP